MQGPTRNLTISAKKVGRLAAGECNQLSRLHVGSSASIIDFLVANMIAKNWHLGTAIAG